jgi:hypothetical protein
MQQDTSSSGQSPAEGTAEVLAARNRHGTGSSSMRSAGRKKRQRLQSRMQVQQQLRTMQ